MIKSYLKTTIIYKLLVMYRVLKAKFILKDINVFSQEVDDISSDYGYSIKENYRTLMQVINIEYCIKYIKENSISGSFVETGTWTGGASSYALLSMMRNNTVRTYWGFDSFEGMPSPTVEDGDHGKKWIGDDNTTINNADREACYQFLLNTGYEKSKINLIKGWFEDTLSVHKRHIGKISILRLDGDFYESTKVVMEQLYPQVVDGGVVIIDDYGHFEGCRRAIKEFAPEQKILYGDDGVRYFIKHQKNNLHINFESKIIN
jgi:O-methyltransferase